MISVIITSFNEPKSVGRAIESFLVQNIKYEHKIIAAAPDKATQDVIASYEKDHDNVKLFKDPGKGKSFALNMIFKEAKGDILILTDGDVYVNDNSVNEIMALFKDNKMGCLTGRPVSTSPRRKMLGFWSHLLADAGAHRIRMERFRKGKFIECSGYLFAFRNNGVVKEIPLDVAEDAIIPYMFWDKGYRIGYAHKAEVYVKNPDNFGEWVKQRKRTAAAHENLTKYIKNFPKVKSFWNEATKGALWAWQYPRDIKEHLWTAWLMIARLYMWIGVFHQIHIKNSRYNDGWDRIESTK